LKWQWYKYRLEGWSIYVLLFIIFTSGYYVALAPKQISSVTSILILVGLFLLLRNQNKTQLFPWERMIKSEQQHHMNYYKFVNMFTDVKHLKETAVRRSY
ncbi:multidrug ABC transporter ATP-binding protein, partial [Enterobacter mori]